jgi:UDP-glucose 4-epimerase
VNVPAAYGEVFNIGADKPYSVNYLAKVVAQAFDDQEPRIRYLPARTEVVHAYSDHAKARRLLGQGDAVDLEEGVRRMAKWAQQVGARKSQGFEHIEVRKNLPSSWRE